MASTVRDGYRPEQRYLLARTAGRLFAIPASSIRRTLRDLTVHPVPGARPPLVGLAQFAGEPLPVLELLALEKGPVPLGGHDVTVVVNRADGGGPSLVGLAVQEALQVVSLPEGAVEAVDRGAVVGLARLDAGEILVVDPARIGGE